MGVTALTRAVSGEKQIYSGNLEILPGIGKPGKFSGKFEILSGHWEKIYFIPFIKLRFVIKHSGKIRMPSLWRTIWKVEQHGIKSKRVARFLWWWKNNSFLKQIWLIATEVISKSFKSSKDVISIRQSPYLRTFRKWKLFALSRGRVISQLVNKERGRPFKAPLVFQRNQVALLSIMK